MGDKGTLALMIVVLVLIVGMLIYSYIRKKRYNTELTNMRNDLKIGDKVMIDTGVVGELVDTYEEEGYKYFVLKSGRGSNVGYFAVHANAIYYVFGKEESNTKIKSIANQQIKDETVETKKEEDLITKIEEEKSTSKNNKNKKD